MFNFMVMGSHLQRKLIGRTIIRLDEVDSTSSYLLDLLAAGNVGEGTVVISPHQTAGRGMDDTIWESEAGKNLTFSFVLFPEFLPAEKQFYLNMFTALAVREIVQAQVTVEVTIKWPNDIYIGSEKVAGILMQTGIRDNVFQYAVIGVGLNVNQTEFSRDIPNPVSLKLASGKDHDTITLLEELLGGLDRGYELLKSRRPEEVHASYIEHLYRYGVWSDYSVHGRRTRAVIRGIDLFGRLLLEMPDSSTATCQVKEVEFLSKK